MLTRSKSMSDTKISITKEELDEAIQKALKVVADLYERKLAMMQQRLHQQEETTSQLKEEVNRLEQYSRRSHLRIRGLKLEHGQNCKEAVSSFICQNLKKKDGTSIKFNCLDLKPSGYIIDIDIKRCHKETEFFFIRAEVSKYVLELGSKSKSMSDTKISITKEELDEAIQKALKVVADLYERKLAMLQQRLHQQEETTSQLKEEVNRLEQYSRRSHLRIRGLKLEHGQNCKEAVSSFICQNLKKKDGTSIKVSANDLDAATYNVR
ncbi:hypothetical protein CAPTEDRAFT_199711 [Capitella teleta]|uniref:Uncharacterized protein n=1 Tax=Capitella teleta TaxID=283909 RepID=R7TBD5_CAPTE|nr:hypothetical protein CAPTEDRAFT_199711 [Capitella teleta]|eukprot:ELT91053.1 hypothetical protein CAPTEDRAFT_199711 [Capitella teleta]